MAEQLLLPLRVQLRFPTSPKCDHIWERLLDYGPFRCIREDCNAVGFPPPGVPDGEPRAMLCGTCCCMAFGLYLARGVAWCKAHRLPKDRAAHIKACTLRKMLPWWFDKNEGPTGMRHEDP